MYMGYIIPRWHLDLLHAPQISAPDTVVILANEMRSTLDEFIRAARRNTTGEIGEGASLSEWAHTWNFKVVEVAPLYAYTIVIAVNISSPAHGPSYPSYMVYIPPHVDVMACFPRKFRCRKKTW